SKPAQGSQPVSSFLTETKRDHCEYFASAATLMLRSAGIPARYVVGFSVQEYDEDEELFVVRSRHGHAWTEVWLKDRWLFFDPTPAGWFEMENGELSLGERLFDLGNTLLFLFNRWRLEEAGKESDATTAYLAAGILFAVLVWRLQRRGRRGRRLKERDEHSERGVEDGERSPFSQVVETLIANGYERPTGEPLLRWTRRHGLTDLQTLVMQHYRFRFGSGASRKEVGQSLREKIARTEFPD
ncbi:MAG: transglutaminase domain-containing protein, partial [Magnetococcales bacterium]|nr:transglutaminase domain-containing protein [Magnetococcales bacterium]